MVRTAYIIFPIVVGVFIISNIVIFLLCLFRRRRKVMSKRKDKIGIYLEGGNTSTTDSNMFTGSSYGGWGWDWTFSTVGDTVNGEGGENSLEVGDGNGGLAGGNGGGGSGVSIHETGCGGGDSGGRGVSEHGVGVSSHVDGGGHSYGGGGTSSNDHGGGGSGGGGFSDFGGGGSSIW